MDNVVIGVHAGHGKAGGIGCGAVGYKDESQEARNIKNALLLKLDAHSTRWRDHTYTANAPATTILNAIVEEINTDNPDISISIHLNSSHSKLASGIEAFYWPGDKKGEELAKALCKHASTLTGMSNRGAKARKDLVVINSTRCSSVLFECGFVSSKQDMDRFRPEDFAEAIIISLKDCGYIKQTELGVHDFIVRVTGTDRKSARYSLKEFLHTSNLFDIRN